MRSNCSRCGPSLRLAEAIGCGQQCDAHVWMMIDLAGTEFSEVELAEDLLNEVSGCGE